MRIGIIRVQRYGSSEPANTEIPFVESEKSLACQIAIAGRTRISSCGFGGKLKGFVKSAEFQHEGSQVGVGPFIFRMVVIDKLQSPLVVLNCSFVFVQCFVTQPQ